MLKRVVGAEETKECPGVVDPKTPSTCASTHLVAGELLLVGKVLCAALSALVPALALRKQGEPRLTN